MIVVDASALIEALLDTPAGRTVVNRLFAEEETGHAPHLIDLEIVQVLRRYVYNGELNADRAEQILEDLADFPIVRYPHSLFVSRIWELRNNLTAYDAVYVALAEILEATLLTCDAGLASAPGHHAQVEIVQPFETGPAGKQK